MGKKKKKPEPMPVMRKCDCWLEIGTCYCEMDKYSSIRYSVLDSKGGVHSRWETLQEALDDGRARMDGIFVVYDNLEKRIALSYGEQ